MDNVLSGRDHLIQLLERYLPFNEQETADKALILKLLHDEPRLFSRDCLHAHMTASAWVVNPERTHVLMAWHNLYRSWSWLGGHADDETDLAAVALREVVEESGVSGARLVSPEILSVEILTVDGHVKRGAYVPSHLHLNLTWLVEADDHSSLQIKPDENSAVRWFLPDEAVAASCEPWFREHIYSKLNRRVFG